MQNIGTPLAMESQISTITEIVPLGSGGPFFSDILSLPFFFTSGKKTLLLGHLTGCRKNGKLCRNFSAILCEKN